MNLQRPLLAALLAFGVCSLAGNAQAQTERAPSGYTYDFEPDDLVGETLATTPPLIRVRPQPLRVMLLRPRASFVAEMLKSVEAL
jgi:hypothetical protein